jgi:CHAD domain-containing protein
MTPRRNALCLVEVGATVRPDAGLDCASAFRHIAGEALAVIETQHAKACAGGAEAVHRMRIALTRLRAARAFFAAMVTDAVWRDLKDELSWLNGRLGAVRDCDVMRGYARRKAYRGWAARIAIDDRLDEARHRRRLAKALRSRRYRRLIGALTRWSKTEAWPTRPGAAGRQQGSAPVRVYAERQLRRWRRRLVGRGHDVGGLCNRARHDLRIMAKRYRYIVEALAALDPALSDVRVETRGATTRVQTWAESGRLAKRIQRALGALRDLQRFRKLGRKRAKLPGYKRAKRRLMGHADAALRRLRS